MSRPEFENVPLSPAVIDNIIKNVGGQEQDLDRLLTGLRRGDAYVPVQLEIKLKIDFGIDLEGDDHG